MIGKYCQVMVIELAKREEQAPKAQAVFTKYGSCILTRQGVHDPNNNMGVITLSIRAEDEYMDEFSKELSAIPGIRVIAAKQRIYSCALVLRSSFFRFCFGIAAHFFPWICYQFYCGLSGKAKRSERYPLFPRIGNATESDLCACFYHGRHFFRHIFAGAATTQVFPENNSDWYLSI